MQNCNMHILNLGGWGGRGEITSKSRIYLFCFISTRKNLVLYFTHSEAVIVSSYPIPLSFKKHVKYQA